MVKAFARAIQQLSDTKLRRVFWIGVVGSAAVFAILWSAIGVFLATTELLQLSLFSFLINLDFISDILGNLAAAALTWLLFPSVIILVAGLFLEDVAAILRDEVAERREEESNGGVRRISERWRRDEGGGGATARVADTAGCGGSSGRSRRRASGRRWRGRRDRAPDHGCRRR